MKNSPKMKSNYVALTFIVMSCLHLTVSEGTFHIDPTEEGKMNFTQIAELIGLKCEEHDVVTKDGYVLTLFHVPGDRSRPVFLLSGNLGSADDYIARGNTSLPAVLARAGYDVWVGNWRGCHYGRRHTSLDPDRDPQFWNYSVHEYAKYDASAIIDYILNHTDAKRVACIGWSLGTTTFYLLGALEPEYNNKVAVLISLAPIGYIHHSQLFQKVAPVYPLIKMFFEMTNMNEVFGDNATITTLLRYVCDSGEFGYQLCIEKWFFPMFGYDKDNLEPRIIPVMFGHFPTAVSRKALDHLSQIYSEQRIAHYDYGPTENLAKYGSVIPPTYDLSRNNMSVVLVSGKNDLVSTLPDVEMLKARLPNVVDHVLLEPGNFNHLDFAYGRTAYEVLYEPYVLLYLKKYL